MPQGSSQRAARVVAGAVGRAAGWTIGRARAAGDAFASRSGPERSSCALAALTAATASISSQATPCSTGMASTIRGAWSHLQEVEEDETRALRADRAHDRAQRRAAERRAERLGEGRKETARRAAAKRAERRAERDRVQRAERRADRRERARDAAARRKAADRARRKAHASGSGWRNAPIVTWYGPGFYGNRTACGVKYTRRIIGVAHRSLPCGTLVEFKWHGITAVAPVIDRGPFAGSDYVFDFSAAMACDVFKPRKIDNSCFTRYDVRYRVVGRVALRSYLRQQ